MAYKDTRSHIIRQAAKKAVPVLGEFELTSKCNLRCKMCYVVGETASTDLSTDKWKDIFKDAADAGLLFAVLTGGEIFTRKDFSELYAYLYDLGVRITLFTNGSALSDAILQTLEKRPPESIVITLYGGDSETYEKVTQKTYAFQAVSENIDRLKARRFHLQLRTIPLTPIYETLDTVIKFAQSKNETLQYTEYIGPTRQGDFSYADWRLEPKALKAFGDKLQNTFFKNAEKSGSTNTAASHCAALRSAYFVNHQGLMQPCAMAYKPARSILEDGIKSTFDHLSGELRAIEDYAPCASCPLSAHCLQCYARRLLETTKPDACPPYLKAYAETTKASKTNE